MVQAFFSPFMKDLHWKVFFHIYFTIITIQTSYIKFLSNIYLLVFFFYCGMVFLTIFYVLRLGFSETPIQVSCCFVICPYKAPQHKINSWLIIFSLFSTLYSPFFHKLVKNFKLFETVLIFLQSTFSSS